MTSGAHRNERSWQDDAEGTSPKDHTCSHVRRNSMTAGAHAAEKNWEEGTELTLTKSHTRSPLFKPRFEAKTVELFFDLFFVANLTVFAIDHEINDGSSMYLYVPFCSWNE